jgi:Protein of unknown function (DUF3224)
MKAIGEFEVNLEPLEFSIKGNIENSLGRMSIDKTFSGDLIAQSKGEMLSVITGVKGSAGYVAIELVSGDLGGQYGSFVLQHFATMDRGKQHLILEVVPDSGTGHLAGLSGRMSIRIDNGRHFYEFDYESMEQKS